MNRKEFLHGCTGGACACAMTGFLSAPAGAAEGQNASEAKPDWRLGFVQKRFAHLLTQLSERLNAQEMSDLLFAQGSYCSALGDETLKKYRGDVEGYAAFIRKTVSADIITYDRATHTITMTTDARPDCFCPFNSLAQHTPEVVCNCSLGWQTHSWQTLLGRKVEVELTEAVLRGGQRCTFKIHVLEQAV